MLETSAIRVENGCVVVSLLRRGMLRAIPPFFLETISCLVVIMGEIGDSGHNLGWDDDGKMTTIPNEFWESSLGTAGWKIRACFGRVSITLTLSPLGVEIRLVSLVLGSQSSLQRIA